MHKCAVRGRFACVDRASATPAQGRRHVVVTPFQLNYPDSGKHSMGLFPLAEVHQFLIPTMPQIKLQLNWLPVTCLLVALHVSIGLGGKCDLAATRSQHAYSFMLLLLVTLTRKIAAGPEQAILRVD